MIGEMPAKRLKLPLLKVKGGQQLEFQVLCDSVFGFRVHWIGNRSLMCAGDLCPACPDWESRWCGFLYVRSFNHSGVKARGLLELSATTFDRLNGLLRLSGEASLLGLVVGASRARGRSPLVLEPLGIGEPVPEKSAEPLQVWEAISTLYGLPVTNGSASPLEWSEKAAPVAAGLLERAMVQARSSG